MPTNATADLVLESRTPNGKNWSCNDLPSKTKELYDPQSLLSPGDVITVHSAKTKKRLFLLRVKDRDGAYAHLKWLGRDG